jgi:hypothetical protein
VLSFKGLSAFGRPKNAGGSGVFTNTEESAPFLCPFACPDEPAE